MRIAVWHNLSAGGGRRALRDHISGLVGLGHDLELWAPPLDDRHQMDLAPLVPYHEVPLRTSFTDRLTRGLPYGADLSVRGRLRAMDQHCATVAAAINQGGFDVVFTATCRYFNASFLGRHTTSPNVLYLQEPHRLLYEAPNVWALDPFPRSAPDAARRILNDVRAILLRRQVREERVSAASYDRILVNSMYSQDAVSRSYGLHAQVCRLGVDPDAWPTPPTTSSRGFVGVGDVMPHKDPLFVIRSVALLAPPRPTIRWIGHRVHEPYRALVESEAARLDVPFHLMLGVSDEQLRHELASAVALVAAPRLEPFGYVPLEAACLGVPTIGVAEGGLRETVLDGETGFLVERREEDLAQRLSEVLAAPDISRRLGAAAQRWVADRWTLDSATASLERHLCEVAGGLRAEGR